MVSMFHTSLFIHGRCKIFLFSARTNVKFFRDENGSSNDQTISEKNIKLCKTQCKNNIFHRHAKKKVWESEDEKYVMFISSMVLQWIMTFCTYQQKLKKCMKPQFQWEKCWTHFWPSMEDVNLSFFCADKLRVIRADIDTFTDGTLSREGKKHCKTQYKINIFHIHTIKLQLASGNPQLPPYIYTCVCHTIEYWMRR